MKTESGLAQVNETRLAWIRSGPRGSGVPSVLLAHGLTDAAASWDPVAVPLSRSYDVVRFDARGHGGSDWSSDYSVESNTADLIELARVLRLDRPVLIGHSMGGVHAALAAAQMEVRALVLEDPHWPEVAEDGTKDVAASRRSVFEVAALPEAERRAYGRALNPTWAEGDLQVWVEAQSRVDPGVVSWFRSWATTNRWRSHIAALSCPGLLVTGDRSPTVTPDAAAQAATLWPQLQTVQVEGAGHNVRRDQFKPYWQALSTFLDRTLH